MLLNTERTYKREGHASFEHFVGSLTDQFEWPWMPRNGRAAEGERELPFIYSNRRSIDRFMKK